MARMKKFLIYLIVVVAVYFFVDFTSFAYIKTTYEDLTDFSINLENPKIRITESKSTYINGYIKGTLLNNEDYTIDKKYVKFEFFSSNNICLGKKYIKLEKFTPNEEKEFEVRFNLENVKSYKISLADENENISEEELKLDPETKGILLFTTLITLYLI